MPTYTVKPDFMTGDYPGVDGTRLQKIPVRVASTGFNIDITTGGFLTVDGETLVLDDRVLLKDQTDPIENGIYLAKVGTWVRAADHSTTTVGGVNGGYVVLISAGVLNGNRTFRLDGLVTITVDTDPATYSSSGGSGIGDASDVPLVPGSDAEQILGANEVQTALDILAQISTSEDYTLESATLIANGAAFAATGVTLNAGQRTIIMLIASKESAPFADATDFDELSEFTIVHRGDVEPLIEPTAGISAGDVSVDPEAFVSAIADIISLGTGFPMVSLSANNDGGTGGVALLTVTSDGIVSVGHDDNGGAAAGNAVFVVFQRLAISPNDPFWDVFTRNNIIVEPFDTWNDTFWNAFSRSAEITEPFDTWGDAFWGGRTSQLAEDFEGVWP